MVHCLGVIISKRSISGAVQLPLHGQYLNGNPNQKRPFTNLSKTVASIENVRAASSTGKSVAVATLEVPWTQWIRPYSHK